MLTYLNRIWHDSTLYGDKLTHLPDKLWKFSTSNSLITYTQPDPGYAKRTLLIFEEYKKTTRFPNGNIDRIEFKVNILPLKYAELGVRRIGGALLTAGAILTFVPFGFAIKIIHSTSHNFQI